MQGEGRYRGNRFDNAELKGQYNITFVINLPSRTIVRTSHSLCGFLLHPKLIASENPLDMLYEDLVNTCGHQGEVKLGTRYLLYELSSSLLNIKFNTQIAERCSITSLIRICMMSGLQYRKVSLVRELMSHCPSCDMALLILILISTLYYIMS